MFAENNQSSYIKGSLDGEGTLALVAIDIDGTLVTSENKLPADLAPLIRETQARGIGITLVSGRPKLKIIPLLQELGLTLPFIGLGGAYIADPSTHQLILHSPLEQTAVKAVVELARARHASIIAQEPETLYYEGSPEELERLVTTARIDSSGIEGAQVVILRVENILRACAEPTKITLYSNPDNLLVIERGLHLLRLPLYATYSDPAYLEITSAGVNKGEALKVLTRHLGISLERTLVIGDSPNDISMFLIAGRAIAMGNATEAVKAAADVIAPSNDEGGVAWVLRELVLKGREHARSSDRASFPSPPTQTNSSV